MVHRDLSRYDRWHNELTVGEKVGGVLLHQHSDVFEHKISERIWMLLGCFCWICAWTWNRLLTAALISKPAGRLQEQEDVAEVKSNLKLWESSAFNTEIKRNSCPKNNALTSWLFYYLHLLYICNCISACFTYMSSLLHVHMYRKRNQVPVFCTELSIQPNKRTLHLTFANNQSFLK